MIKYLVKYNQSSLYKFSTDDNDLDIVNSDYCIDYSFWIPEDGELIIIDKNNNRTTRKVQKGDLVLKMYSNTNDSRDREYFVVNASETAKYISKRIEYMERRNRVESEHEACGNCDCERQSYDNTAA